MGCYRQNGRLPRPITKISSPESLKPNIGTRLPGGPAKPSSPPAMCLLDPCCPSPSPSCALPPDSALSMSVCLSSHPLSAESAGVCLPSARSKISISASMNRPTARLLNSTSENRDESLLREEPPSHQYINTLPKVCSF